LFICFPKCLRIVPFILLYQIQLHTRIRHYMHCYVML